MTTFIALEDGRILGATNGSFDGVLEAVADNLAQHDHRELAEWLLVQRCEVLGPGVGSLDLREMSPIASEQFRDACHRVYDDLQDGQTSPEWMQDHFRQLIDMWASMARGEPPESLTSDVWQIHPASDRRVGPGW